MAEMAEYDQFVMQLRLVLEPELDRWYTWPQIVAAYEQEFKHCINLARLWCRDEKQLVRLLTVGQILEAQPDGNSFLYKPTMFFYRYAYDLIRDVDIDCRLRGITWCTL